MTTILEIRERLKDIYSKYDTYLLILFRFVVAVIALNTIVSMLGSGGRLDNALVISLVSILCGLLGGSFTVIACGIFIIFELSAIAIDLAVAMFAIFVLFLCLYFAVASDDGMVLILSALGCALGIPFFMPVAAGLMRKVNSALPVGFGVFTYYLIKIMSSASLKSTADSSEATTLSTTINQLTANREFFMILVISIATVCVVYFIRRVPLDYIWLIAILFGTLFQLLLTVVGNFVLGLHMTLLSVFVGFFIAVILCLILTFFAFNLDYNRVENVQFEDDEYYYYVRAIPKVSMAPKNKQEKVINAAKRTLRRDEEEDDEE